MFFKKRSSVSSLFMRGSWCSVLSREVEKVFYQRHCLSRLPQIKSSIWKKTSK